MRILAGFFALVFIFVNPAMIVHVLGQIERLLRRGPQSPFKPEVFSTLEELIEEGDALHQLRLANLCIAGTLIFIHIVLSILHCYGCFTGRPAYIRPMIVDCVFSTFVLFVFMCISIFVSFNIRYGEPEQRRAAAEFESDHKFHLTIGGIFFVVYLVWDAVIFYTYFDIKQLHEDFMYWIVEEKNSLRKGSLRLSTDRSGGSSKSSKASKNSTKSSKMEDHSRPNSAAASIPSKKTSLANNRLSVPL